MVNLFLQQVAFNPQQVFLELRKSFHSEFQRTLILQRTLKYHPQPENIAPTGEKEILFIRKNIFSAAIPGHNSLVSQLILRDVRVRC